MPDEIRLLKSRMMSTKSEVIKDYRSRANSDRREIKIMRVGEIDSTIPDYRQKPYFKNQREGKYVFKSVRVKRLIIKEKTKALEALEVKIADIESQNPRTIPRIVISVGEIGFLTEKLGRRMAKAIQLGRLAQKDMTPMYAELVDPRHVPNGVGKPDFGYASEDKPASVRITQIISPTEMMVDFYGETLWLHGYPTKDLTDDQMIRLDGVYYIAGTKTYTTARGTQRTVLAVHKIDIDPWQAYLAE